MNRKSLFARFAAPTTASQPAVRQEYFRVHLEPLEDRRLLTALYVSNTWLDSNDPGGTGTVAPGDPLTDVVTGITATAGTTGFGYITFQVAYNDFTQTGTPVPVQKAGSVPATRIADAVAASANGDTIDLLPQWNGGNYFGGAAGMVVATFAESDIVLNTQVTLEGNSFAGTTQNSYVIVPDTSSAHATEEDLPAGSHQGIIIDNSNVSVLNLTVDGGGSGFGSQAFQNGITTAYDTMNGQGAGQMVTERNGTLTAGTFSSLTVNGVTVKNTWYRGITLSGPDSKTGSKYFIENDTLSNIGSSTDASSNPTTQSEYLQRIGILVQNIDQADVRNNNVTGAGVGIESGVFGAKISFGGNNSTTGRNKSGILANTVTNAIARGYSVTYEDSGFDSSILTNTPAEFDDGFVANTATFAAGNLATAVYIDHSLLLALGGTYTNAHIGIQIVDTTLNDTVDSTLNPSGGGASGSGAPSHTLILPVLGGNVITGPGSGDSISYPGSVGILAENQTAGVGNVFSTLNNSVSFAATGGTTVSGYQTGVKSDQAVTPGDTGITNTEELDRVIVTGNGTGVVAGAGAVLFGSSSKNSTDPLIISAGGSINLALPTQADIAATTLNGNAPITVLPPTTDTFNSGNVTLSSTSTFGSLITGQTGSHDLFNFNAPLSAQTGSNTYQPGSIPTAPSGGTLPAAAGTTNFIATQTGSGTVEISGFNATGGAPGVVFGTNGTLIPPFNLTYTLHPVDVTDSTYFNVVAKLNPGNLTTFMLVGIVDVNGTVDLWEVPTSLLNTSTYTTISVNLLSPGAVVGLNNDISNAPTLDLSKVVGWALGGDFGLTNEVQNVPFDLSLDDISTSSTPAGQLNVTGTVNLGGATLTPTISAGFSPTEGQAFTIINNDGSDPVSGTFNGLAEGAGVMAGSKAFQLSYVGGTGNDVTLTHHADLVDLNGPAVAGSNFSTVNWTTPGIGVNIADPTNAQVLSDSANLDHLTVSFDAPAPHPGDILEINPTYLATLTANGITATGGIGSTLTLSGSSSVANYQAALQNVLYDNTLTGPGVTSESLSVVAYDGSLNSPTVHTTVNISVVSDVAPVVNLNGSSGTFTVKGIAGSDTPVLIASAATVTDSDSPLLAFVTVTLPAHATGDALAVSSGGLAVGMTATYTSATGVLTISGAFSPAQYTTALQHVTYTNTTSLGPGVTSETYTVVANDGLLSSTPVNGTVNIDISITNNLLFYKGSTGFDTTGHAWTPNAFSDDNAVAIDKTAYVSGAGAATFNSVSSYFDGINGLMIDIAGAHNTILNTDFILRTGNNNTPSLWTTIPTASITVTTRSGATGSSHLSGTDRIEITMANLLVKNKWLEVIFKGADRSDTNTLLATSDVFFYASSIGDDGIADGSVAFIVDPSDVLGARANQKGLINNIPITNIYDYDRSHTVDPGDVLIARSNQDGSISAPKLLNITGSLAPDSSGGAGAAVAGGGGISSGLTDSASASTAPTVPTWLANRLANVDLNSGRIATFFEDLAAKDTPKARKILLAADELADSLGLDDDLLDSLVAGLPQS